MTLVEALVCIFIATIGTLSTMAIFPVGAKSMSDALIDDRMTAHALSMDALVRTDWKVRVVEDPLHGNEPYWSVMDNPGTHPSGTTVPPIPSTSTEPSYPVFLDPMGWVGRGPGLRDWVGDGATAFVPRRSTFQIGNNTQMALRLWSQPDGFAADEDGQPVASSFEMREWRYNALAVLQRPSNRDRYTATLKIVTFDGRRHLFFPAGSEAVFGNVAFAPGTTQIRLSVADGIKKGTWIMDGTVQGAIRHANFYRVVSATEDTNTPGTYDVELHTPIKRVDGGTVAYTGTVVVLAGIRDVFERPLLTGGSNP